jgi:hypothetical protein
MGIRHHEVQREVRRHEGVGQRGETERRQQELRGRRRLGHRHPARTVQMCTHERHDHLEDGHHEGEDQREVSEFYDHGP